MKQIVKAHSWRQQTVNEGVQCPVDRGEERLPEPRSSSSGVAHRDVTQARRMKQTCVQGTGCDTNTVGGQQQIVVNEGEALFVVGANGTGKSSLMQRFFTQHRNNAKRISAHRQTWFTSNTLDFTPATRKRAGVNLENDDAQESARWMDRHGSERSSAAIFDLINADNIRSRKIAEQIDLGALEAALAANEEEGTLQVVTKALEAKKEEAPLKVLNELLKTANLPFKYLLKMMSRYLLKNSGEIHIASPNFLMVSGMPS